MSAWTVWLWKTCGRIRVTVRVACADRSRHKAAVKTILNRSLERRTLHGAHQPEHRSAAQHISPYELSPTQEELRTCLEFSEFVEATEAAWRGSDRDLSCHDDRLASGHVPSI